MRTDRAGVTAFLSLLAAMVHGAAAQCPAPVPGPVSIDASGPCAVRVSWNPVQGATRYSVGVRRGSDQPWSYSPVTGTEFLDTAPLGGAANYYRVASLAPCGQYSAYSPEGSIAPQHGPPGAPSVYASDDCTYVTFSFSASWQRPAREYRLWRSVGDLSQSVHWFSFSTQQSWWTWRDIWVVGGIPVNTWLEAVDGECSTFSPAVTITRTAATPPPTSAAASLGRYCNAVHLSWRNGRCADTTRVLRSESADPAGAMPISVQPVDDGWVDGSTAPGVPYFYWLVAQGPLGDAAPVGPLTGMAGDVPPTVEPMPDSHAWVPGEAAALWVEASGALDLSYQWRRDGVPLVESPRVRGVNSPQLQIDSCAEEDQGVYDVVVRSACGMSTSNPVEVTVSSAACFGGCWCDINQDGGIDGADVEYFFGLWEQGSACGDVNQDGGVDGSDAEYYLLAWEMCCC